MSFLEVHNNAANEIILNTPNRQEILKEGPPQNSKCNILGRGAYGTVFKAVFRAKQVAVKIVKNLKDINLQSMRNEANILGWDHRNIVKILKIESTSNFGIVIMERFSGHCLQSILEFVPLPLEHRVLISLDILSALSYCHKRKLLHLDLKPQNVLVSLEAQKSTLHKGARGLPYRRKYVCKLCDFGSSMLMMEQKENIPTGIPKGTVRYMSPEALREERLAPAADIYSLGITMWQLEQRCLPYYWIECNEVVAYQVVKNNLRPNAEISLSREGLASETSGIKLHHNCRCDNFSSEMSYECVKDIKEFLNRNEQAEHEVLFLSQRRAITQKTDLLSARKPFQNVNSILKYNSNAKVSSNTHTTLKPNTGVVRNLGNELDMLTSLDYGLNCGLTYIFQPFSCPQDICKEGLYKALYESCWCWDHKLRPKVKQLRKSLEKLF